MSGVDPAVGEVERLRAQVEEFRALAVRRGQTRSMHTGEFTPAEVIAHLDAVLVSVGDGALIEPTCDGIPVGDQMQPWAECGRTDDHPGHPLTPPPSGAADETLRQAVDGLLRSQEMQTADDVLREAEGMCEERPPCGVCLAIAGNGLDGAHSAWLREQRAAAWAEGAQAMTSAQSHDVYHLMVAAPPNPYRVAARGVPSTDALTTEPPPCPEHREVQHRDGKPPWCRACGWNHGRPAIPARKIRDVDAPATEAGA